MPANDLPIANYQNPFQLGELQSDQIPVEVWLQVQPGDVNHNSKTMAICEQRRIDFITKEKEKKLKRFQRAVKRRLQKRARQKEQAQRLEHLIPSELSSSRMMDDCNEGDFTISTAMYSLPKHWTPHQPNKLREARIRQQSAQSRTGKWVGVDAGRVKVAPDMKQQSSMTHIDDHPIFGNNMLQCVVKQNLIVSPSIASLCQTVDVMNLEGDEDLEYLCGELQFLRRSARGRMVEKVKRRTNDF